MKASDYRKMTDEELAKELDGLRKNLFGIRTKKVTDVLEKSSVVRTARRDIARVLTVIRERQPVSASAPGRANPAPPAKPAAPSTGEKDAKT